MRKRGQITIFAVIGVILLVAAGLFIFIRYQLSGPQLKIPDDVSESFGHIQTFTESCIYNVGKEAILKLGEHGGYIYPQDAGIIAIPGFPTKSAGFEFMKGTGFIIPYWDYMSSPDNCVDGCVFDSKKPPLTGESPFSIESQIESYVKDNIDDCLNGYEFFKDQQYIIPDYDVENVQVEFSDDSVIITISDPLPVAHEDKEIVIDGFSTELDVKLKKMYELSEQMIDDRIADFFSVQTRDFVAEGSLGDNAYMPPIGDDFKVGMTNTDYWILSEVKDRFQSDLMSQVPTIQVLFARNADYFDTDNDFVNSIYNKRLFIMNLTEIDFEDIYDFDVNFVYLGWWPIYMKINPGGQVIRPKPVGVNLGLFQFGWSEYKFDYDVSYPVMSVLTDPYAFNNEGYVFQFGFESNLRKSMPLFVEMNTSELAEDDVMEINRTIDFCSPGQRSSGPVTITINETYTKQPVSDVLVDYECFTEACMLGETGADGVLQTTLPPCYGGYITTFREGYSSVMEPLTISAGMTAFVPITLTKEKEFNITVKKHPLRKDQFSQWHMDVSSSHLEPDDMVFLLFEKVIEGDQPEYIKFITLNGTSAGTVKLVPGNYTIEGTYLRTLGEGHDPEEIIIPGTEIDDVELPEIKFNSSILLGGITFDENHTWELKPDDFYENNAIKFFVVGLALDEINTYNDLDMMDAYSSYSVSERDILEPVFEE